MRQYKLYFSSLISILFLSVVNAQDPHPKRFQSEIDDFNLIEFNDKKDRIVFTGSSSIRLWKNINQYYPNHQIINTGFGGSHMSDLLYFIEETVFQFSPSKVFIYEGDNDVANGVSEKDIIKYTEKVIKKIHTKFPSCEIIFIAPKPSIARWKLRNEYLSVCSKLNDIAKSNSKVSFINVWEVMLNEHNELKENLFLDDNLHMNSNGYDLWDEMITPYLNN